MSRDWHAWYRAYDDPTSSLVRRREVVRRQLSALLDDRPADATTRLLSLCAGDGGDTLPVLALGHAVRAVLVEIDAELADRARSAARDLGLDDVVEVHIGDAGTTTCAAGAVPADVVMMCGVFGNVTDADVARTVAAAPSLLAPGGAVVWTRGSRVDLDPTEVDCDPAQHVRSLFLDGGFDEVDFVAPEDASFRVGVHRLRIAPRPYRPDVRMFDFV